MISGSDPSVGVGRVEQRVDLVLFQVTDGNAGRAFEHNRTYSGAPWQVLRRSLRDERRQRVDCCQPLIPGRNAAPSDLFDVAHELSHQVRTDVFYKELI